MTLSETYKKVQNGIVALGSRLVPTAVGQRPLFPTIIGTGFVVDERGLIATNKHVVDALMRLPAHPVTGQPSAFAIVWLPVQSEAGEHTLGTLLVDVKGFFLPECFTATGAFFGQDMPDLAFVQLNVRDLSPLSLATQRNFVEVGMSVATAGFPSGSELMTIYGKLTQITPMLRAGIVSSVIPFQCPLPHGFIIDAMVQGGASGSPVFRSDLPEIIGIVHASAVSSANTTLCVPSTLIDAAVRCICQDGIDTTGVPSLHDIRRDNVPVNQLEYEKLSFVCSAQKASEASVS
jgi:S1-C subfamily serine protease